MEAHAGKLVNLFFLCLLSNPWKVDGHAYLADPPPRNLLKHWTKQEVCPHCLNANGPANVKRRGNAVWPTALDPSSHGLCGDPVQGRPDAKSLADEPYMIPSSPQQVYKAGTVVEFRVAVSTHHMGHYEFRICNKSLDGRILASAREGQNCLDAWPLRRAALDASCVPGDSRADCQLIDDDHPGRWYLPPAGQGTKQADALWKGSTANQLPAVDEVHIMRFQIPKGLFCDHCTLQWYYATANSCLPDAGYFKYFKRMQAAGWQAAKWSPWAVSSWANCGNACCGPKGKGTFAEEFWNCADVKIVPASAAPSPASGTSQPPGPPTICKWQASAWSPCPAIGCGMQALRARTAVCWCNGAPALASRCNIQDRPNLQETCTGSCVNAQPCELHEWAECGGRRMKNPNISTCCKTSLTCRAYGKIWSQCERSRAVAIRSVEDVIVTVGMRLPTRVDICLKLASLGKQVALWAGSPKAAASCAGIGGGARRLNIGDTRWESAGTESYQNAHGSVEDAGMWAGRANTHPSKSTSERRLSVSCPRNDVGCNCAWATTATCGTDDGSLCWCRCCCPIGGICTGTVGVGGSGGQTNNQRRSQCKLPQGMLIQAPTVSNRDLANRHGKLRLSGVQLVDYKGNAVQLMGMSSHGLHWFDACYSFQSLEYLVDQWGINVFRAALYIGEGGYASKKSLLQSVKNVVDWCEKLGIYVIIDWHVLTPGDPNHWLTGPGKASADADVFWREVATLYKDKGHVLYEICNEPNGVGWNVVKAYADSIIATIRAIDPDTIILVGTPTWSQDIHLAATSPVAQPYNIMYAFHFYAGTHRVLLQRVKDYAGVIPIFVTEWGTSQASGDGGPYLDTAKDFLDVFSAKTGTGVLISWAQWSYADKAEVSAALLPGSCAAAAWNQVSCSGKFVREYIRQALGARSPTNYSATVVQSTTMIRAPQRTSVSTTSVSMHSSVPGMLWSTSSPSTATTTTAAPPAIRIAGAMQMAVLNATEFVGDPYAHVGIRHGIAGLINLPVNSIHVLLQSSRRLAFLRRVRSTRLVKASYTISVRGDVSNYTMQVYASHIVRKLADTTPPSWTFALQTALSISASVSGRGRSYQVNVTSASVALPLSNWQVGAWGACSVTCGTGIRTRSVSCGTITSGATSACDYAKRPLASELCSSSLCPTSALSTVEIQLRIRPRSAAHRSALFARVMNASHFGALEEWLSLWLVQQFGALEVVKSPFIAGHLLPWCEVPRASTARLSSMLPIYTGTNANGNIVYGRLLIEVQNSSLFVRDSMSFEAVRAGIAVLAGLGPSQVLVNLNKSENGVGYSSGCGRSSGHLATAFYIINGFFNATQIANSLRVIGLPAGLPAATAAIQAQLLSLGSAHQVQARSLSAYLQINNVSGEITAKAIVASHVNKTIVVTVHEPVQDNSFLIGVLVSLASLAFLAGALWYSGLLGRVLYGRKISKVCPGVVSSQDLSVIAAWGEQSPQNTEEPSAHPKFEKGIDTNVGPGVKANTELNDEFNGAATWGEVLPNWWKCVNATKSPLSSIHCVPALAKNAYLARQQTC